MRINRWLDKVHLAFSTLHFNFPMACMLVETSVPIVFLVLLNEVINDTVVEIFTTKVGITISSQCFEDTDIHEKEKDIKDTSIKVINDNLWFTTLLAKAICNGGSSRLVDNTKNLEASNSDSILGCLMLIVEV